MNPSEIAPTKTSLFEFKGQLEFSKDGHALLEEKREVLIMHLMEVISKMKANREKLDKLIAECFELRRFAEVSLGAFELNKIISTTREFSRIEVLEKSIMGVVIPTLKYKRVNDHEPVISFHSGGDFYDRLLNHIREMMNLIIVVAQIEASAWRLTHEIQKTQRRVNALENVFIPEFKEIIKFIQDTLEERERETFFQMKRVKNSKIEKD